MLILHDLVCKYWAIIVLFLDLGGLFIQVVGV